MLKLIRYGTLGVAAVLAAVLAYVYFGGEGARQSVLPKVAIGGPFRLASANGGTVDSADLKGKPYGVFFGFTHCPEVCPTTLFEMTRTLTDAGEPANDFRLFFITVDPERDTAAYLKDYLSNFDPRIEALVPTADELAKVARDFHAVYEKVPTSDGSYTMNHTATIYLMGADGAFASTIAYGEPPESRAAKLQKLLAD